MIKLIAIDMDGTALDSHKKISQTTMSAMKLAASRGIIVVPTTGRNLTSLPYQLKAENFYRYVITSNGARVLDLKKHKTIKDNLLPLDTAIALCRAYEHIGCGITAQVNNEYIVQGRYILAIGRITHGKDSLTAHAVRSMTGLLEEFKRRNTAKGVEELQMFYFLPGSDKISEHILKTHTGFAYAEDSDYVEIFSEETSKGAALKNLAAHLGISKSEIACIGDARNDLTMFNVCGLSYAMGSADAYVRTLADRVTASNDASGAANAILQILYEQQK